MVMRLPAWLIVFQFARCRKISIVAYHSGDGADLGEAVTLSLIVEGAKWFGILLDAFIELSHWAKAAAELYQA